MTADTKTAGYAALAVEAESAVATIKDPDLRRAAFEKILTTLLEQKLPIHRSVRGQHRSEAPVRPLKNEAKSPTSKQQSGPKAYVEELIADDFFQVQRTIAQVKAELANRGRHIALTSLSGPLQKLTQERRLRRQKVTTNGKGTKTIYAYSNW